MTNDDEEIDALLDVYEVAVKVRSTKKAIHQRVSRGKFPRPVALGGKKSLWRKKDIAEFISQASVSAQREVPRTLPRSPGRPRKASLSHQKRGKIPSSRRPSEGDA